MAGSGGDKTEKATPKKRKESRDKGQVAKSQDFAGASVLLAGLLTLGAFGGSMVGGMVGQLRSNLHAAADADKVVSGEGMNVLISAAGMTLFSAVAPVAIGCAIAAAVIVAAQVGFKITPKAIKPDFKRMNPLTNAKQTFGPNALVELVKNLLKVGAVGAVVAMIIVPLTQDSTSLVGMEPIALGQLLLTSVMKIAQAAAAAYFVIGIGDFIWQKHRMEKSMKMDKNEVKQEQKGMDLPPEVRQAIKRRQMMASRARQMAAVPDADVIVTNPTHYAVALKYSPDAAAPQVVAKGMDLVAKKIREAATEHGVAIVPDPPLARALHASVEVGQHIPEELYEAVAQVLAFVYRTAGKHAGLRNAA